MESSQNTSTKRVYSTAAQCGAYVPVCSSPHRHFTGAGSSGGAPPSGGEGSPGGAWAATAAVAPDAGLRRLDLAMISNVRRGCATRAPPHPDFQTRERRRRATIHDTRRTSRHPPAPVRAGSPLSRARESVSGADAMACSHVPRRTFSRKFRLLSRFAAWLGIPRETRIKVPANLREPEGEFLEISGRNSEITIFELITNGPEIQNNTIIPSAYRWKEISLGRRYLLPNLLPRARRPRAARARREPAAENQSGSKHHVLPS